MRVVSEDEAPQRIDPSVKTTIALQNTVATHQFGSAVGTMNFARTLYATILIAAFGAIVQSLVGDVLMPIVGAVTGGLDFSNYFIPLSSKVTADTLVEAKKQGAVLAYGNFITLTINFIIVAFVLFMVIRLMNQLIRKEAAKPPPPTKQEELLTEIRDVLKSQPR